MPQTELSAMILPAPPVDEVAGEGVPEEVLDIK